MESWNIVILIFQSVILFFQLALSWKMHIYETSRSKPYFFIKSNYLCHPELIKQLKYHHDLKEPLSFEATGDSAIYLCGSSLYVNGICKDPGHIPCMVSYVPNSNFSDLAVPLALSERELAENKLEINLKLRLQNFSQYRYTQHINMVFSQEESMTSDLWLLTAYNFYITNGHRK